MRRLLLVIALFCLLIATPVIAQDEEPRYAVQEIRTAYVEDNTVLNLQFTVRNLGGGSGEAGTVEVISVANGQTIAQQPVPALTANDTESITFAIPTSDLSPGVQSLRIIVSVNGTPLASTNIGITVPDTPAQPADDPDSEATAPTFEIIGVTIDLDNPLHLLALAGIALGLLLFMIILIFALRMLFRRTPRFTPWQPPYAQISHVNPNSQAGRRQGWQHHAQNDLAPPPHTSEGATHIRKLLTGLGDKPLENWRITTLRLCQYDQYGRIVRTQFIAPSGLVRQLDRAAHTRRDQTAEQTLRSVRPVARRIIRRFVSKLNSRSAPLPIALDIRLRGTHGEVRIQFELFMVQQGQWQLLDRWEPEMIVSETIEESLTYSLYGMRPDETFKTFSQRLQNDLTRLLAQLVNKYPAQQQANKQQ